MINTMKLILFPIAAVISFASAFAADAPQAADSRPVAAPAVRATVSAGSVKAEIGSSARHGKLKKARHSKKAGAAVTAAVK